jgi:hypothetical protein
MLLTISRLGPALTGPLLKVSAGKYYFHIFINVHNIMKRMPRARKVRAVW